MYGDDGKSRLDTGRYRQPTLTFSAAQDIISMSSSFVGDGEQPLDGVIVKYISPEHGYAVVETAPWFNTNWYNETLTPNLLTLEALACQSNRQATVLAKSVGLRSAPPHKIAAVVSLKGLLLSGERIVALDYDEQIAGPYEIASPSEVDAMGMSVSAGLVPVDADRWTLLEGEEKAPIVQAPALDIDDTLELPTNRIVTIEQIDGSGANVVRFVVSTDEPLRADRRFEWRYTPVGADDYRSLIFDDANESADEYRSEVLSDGQEYTLEYRTLAGSGRATEWTVQGNYTAVADSTPPIALTDAFATDNADGTVSLGFSTGNDSRVGAVSIKRDGTDVPPIIATAANTVEMTSDGPGAGTYSYTFTPLNRSNIPGPVTTVSATITDV